MDCGASQASLYDLLGVPPEATVGEISSAYRRCALRWHPDKHADATAEEKRRVASGFVVIANAARVLLDPSLRAAHDAARLHRAVHSIGRVGDKFDFSEFSPVEVDTADSPRISSSSSRTGGTLYELECRCGGVYTIVLGFGGDGALPMPAAAEVQCECDSCSLVVAVGGVPR